MKLGVGRGSVVGIVRSLRDTGSKECSSADAAIETTSSVRQQYLL